MKTTGIRNRVMKLQHDRQPPMLATPLFDCVVDGVKMQLDAVEAAFIGAFNGCEVEIGAQSGVRYTPSATPAEFQENLKEMDRMMTKITDRWRSQTEEERDAEDEELKKIIQLRHEDWQAGRDPDKHHPLPPLY